MNDYTKAPRVYIDTPLSMGAGLGLPEDVHHHLIHVLRKKIGDEVRVFNGHDGEMLGVLDLIDKKRASLKILNALRPQPSAPPPRHLIIPILKKEPMDWMVEKAVELGVTDIHPILCDHADIRQINAARLHAQIMDAACQCERLTLPTLHPLHPLFGILATWPAATPVFAAVERENIPLLSTILPLADGACALLIGPAGGWSESEKQNLSNHPCVTPISLGGLILRAETAAIAGLTLLNIR